MKPSRSRNAIDESLLCQFPFSDGRACRMLRSESHPTLCADHARREQHHLARQQRGHDLEEICSQLAALHAHPHTAVDVQQFLGRVLVLVATDRIPSCIAASLAHRAQLPLDNQGTLRHVA
jgi:hypothetical protein